MPGAPGIPAGIAWICMPGAHGIPAGIVSSCLGVLLADEVGCPWPWPYSWLLHAEHKPLSEAFLGNNDKLWGLVKWFSKSCTGVH